MNGPSRGGNQGKLYEQSFRVGLRISLYTAHLPTTDQELHIKGISKLHKQPSSNQL